MNPYSYELVPGAHLVRAQAPTRRATNFEGADFEAITPAELAAARDLIDRYARPRPRGFAWLKPLQWVRSNAL